MSNDDLGELFEADNPQRGFLWRGGYLATCSEATPRVLSHWAHWSAGHLHLTYDPEQPFSSSVDGSGAFVAVLGPIVSLGCPSTEQDRLVGLLLEALLEGEEAFHAALDACCGRFICLFDRGGEPRVVADATGMKLVFYAESAPSAVASHASLLAAHIEAPPSREAMRFLDESGIRRFNMSFLPGHATTFEGARALPPNTRLDLRSATLRRIFPRAPLSPLSFDEAVQRACSQLIGLLERFARLSPLAISLTAGLDSRLTAAVAERVDGDLLYFTYVRQGEKVNTVDATIARRLAERHALRFEEIPFDHDALSSGADEGFASFEKVARHSIELEHFLSLAYEYTRSYPVGRLHVRSNIGEICRARYYKPPFGQILESDLSLSAKLGAIYNRWTRSAEHPFVRSEFDRYVSETTLATETHGFDVPALYYWEHLMPMWHGSLLLESALSHETVSLFNCRELLCTFLAAPFDDQISARCMRTVIRELCPTMLEEPINPKPETLSAKDATSDFGVRAWIEDDSVRARCSVGGEWLESPVEFAYYLIANGTRVATEWYTPSPEVRFSIEPAFREATIQVKAFVRLTASPKKKTSAIARPDKPKSPA